MAPKKNYIGEFWHGLNIYGRLAVIGVPTIVLVVFGGWIARDLWGYATGLNLRVAGQGIDTLPVNAQVVMSGEAIGTVRASSLVDGRKIVNIRIEPRFASQIVDGCEFQVISGNLLTPGNLVLQISAPADYSERKPLPDGMLVETQSSILPAAIPFGLYYLLGGLVVAIQIGGLGFAIIKQASKFVIYLLIAGIVVAAIWMLTRERLASPSPPVNTPLTRLVSSADEVNAIVPRRPWGISS